MRWYKNLKVRNKLFAGYAMIVILSCALSYYGINGMGVLKALLDDTHDTLLESVVQVTTIDHHVQKHRRKTLQVLSNPDKNERQRARGEMAHEEVLVTNALVKFAPLANSEKERRLLSALTQTWESYREEAHQLTTAAAIAKNDTAWETEKLRVTPLVVEMEKQLDELRLLNVDQADEHYHEGTQAYLRLRAWMIGLILFLTAIAATAATLITRSIIMPLQSALDMIGALAAGGEEKALAAEAIAKGDLSRNITQSELLAVDPAAIASDEIGELLTSVVAMSQTQSVLDRAFAGMTDSLRENRAVESGRDWSKSGLNELNTLMRGDQTTAEMADKVLSFLAGHLKAGAGAFYLFDEASAMLLLVATHALTRRKNLGDRIPLGDGLLGQAAREKKLICVANVPADYLQISSALGEAAPRNIVAIPLLHDGKLVGALEFSTFSPFNDLELEFLNQATEGLAIGLGVAHSRQKINELLEQTQQQTEELRVQQEELQQTNEELEERAELLEQQRKQIEAKNQDIEAASEEIQQKAAEVERVSAYKSEFLANMSHELRTPLNSIMILSSLLKENKEGSLSEKQREFAETINASGKDLLNLINDILDLSKVEAGKMELHYEEVATAAFTETLQAVFEQQAKERGLEFTIAIEKEMPETLRLDEQRTQQILKNLLSNAFKFTEQGAVALHIAVSGSTLLFTVSDTGIGIPADKQGLIFQAFQQADGSTSRKFGGTGLGLSISLQLARRMGGDITLKSEPGKGSAFTLSLPLTGAAAAQAAPAPLAAPAAPAPVPPPATAATEHDSAKPLAAIPRPLQDDRDTLKPNDKSILVIEDDLNFAKTLMTLVREKGFACLVATDGTSGLHLADSSLPSAILLDVMLPGMDGWTVMRSLKDNPRTRHIPVHFITCLDERQKAMAMGAVGFITKPVTPTQLDGVFQNIESAIARTIKKLLIVEDNTREAESMRGLLEGRNLVITLAATGREAIDLLGREQIDCIVLDLGLSDMSGFDLLEHLHCQEAYRHIPVVIHTGRDLSHEEEVKLQRYAKSIIIKGAKSPERLLNEVTLFLHMVESELPREKQRMIRAALDKEAMLDHKKVLLVDDDMRNVFSLSSVLSDKNMTVIEAENGKEALAKLAEHPDAHIVLMDIMMPEMDGYATIREIRRDPRFARLPIIAMTAKALKGDQEKCIQAGANDYIAKPLDIEKLLSLLRVWLYQQA